MAVAHALPRRFAYFEETTFGTGPADWSANGTSMYVIEPDVSGVAQAIEENLNNRFTPRDFHAHIRTLKNTSFTFGCYLHGKTTNAAEGAAATAYNLSTLLKAALGGQDLGYGIGFSGGSAAAPEIDSDPGFAVGDWIWAYDDSATRGEFYRITAIDAGPPIVLTLDRELHFTPAAADRAYSVINCYIDDTVTTQHDHADHETMSFCVQGDQTEDVYALYGCKPAVGFETIEAGQPSRLTFDVMATTFAVETLTADDFSAVTTHGAPGTVPGLTDSTTVLMATVASPMADIGDVRGSIQITPGVTYERVTGPNGLEGVHGHVDTLGDTTIELVIPFDDDHHTAFRAGTKKHLLVQVGDTPTAYPWGVYFPNLEYASEPARSDEGALTGVALSFRALRGPASGSLTGADERRFRSPMQVLLVA
jgi:hypothetical protein